MIRFDRNMSEYSKKEEFILQMLINKLYFLITIKQNNGFKQRHS